MKLHYKNLKLHQLILIVTANLLLVSCGTYQSVYNDDGIYGDVTPANNEQKVIVMNEQEYDDYEEDYFTKKLNALQNIEDNEIFVDVDSYNSTTDYVDDELIDETLNYDASQPWGYENNDVVVNINLINDPYWGGEFNNWGYNYWGYNNNWRFYNNYNYWGFNYGYGNPYWGGNPYWHPYHNNWGWNRGFYGSRWYNTRSYNNRSYTYGRRNNKSRSH